MSSGAQSDHTLINRDADPGQREVREDASAEDIELLRPLFDEFGARGEVIYPDNRREMIGRRD